MQADAVELRVLGSLIEKQRTTPDQYPLSLNALRLACNQATNRDPVVEYDEPMIRAALERLSRKQWVRLASGAGSRAIKYRHLLDETLGLTPSQLAILAVLMLRGPQTPGELKARSERLYPASIEDVDRTLQALMERELVERLPRRPGQSQDRYRHLLGEAAAEEAPVIEPPAPSAAGDAPLETRVRRLEEQVAELRALVSAREQRDAPDTGATALDEAEAEPLER